MQMIIVFICVRSFVCFINHLSFGSSLVYKIYFMNFVVNIAALCLCWFGSASAYAASERQMVFSKPFTKNFGWALFSVSMAGAFILLLKLHHWISATLILIVMITLVWILLALAIPYFPYQRKTLVFGTAITFCTAFIGGFYVV